jgi:hypothetical protein
MAENMLLPHCQRVVDALLRGKVVPFLGAGANLCSRPPGFGWSPSQGGFLPSGAELAHHLAVRFRYPGVRACTVVDCPMPRQELDLARVAQYGETTGDATDLYEYLREIFLPKCPPTVVHDFLASLPSLLRHSPTHVRNQLVVTTNYDGLVEEAFARAGQPIDLVSYDAEGAHKGKFWHQLPEGRIVPIETPNEYAYPFFDDCPVVLKIHGTVDRKEADRDSYVITEDDYIEFLAQVDMTNVIPAPLLARWRNSKLLFLGYSLRDWNLRVILRRLHRSRRLPIHSWAVLLNPESAEEQFWGRNNVEILNSPLADFVGGLIAELQGRPLNG